MALRSPSVKQFNLFWAFAAVTTLFCFYLFHSQDFWLLSFFISYSHFVLSAVFDLQSALHEKKTFKLRQLYVQGRIYYMF